MGPFWSRAEPWDMLRSLLEEADAARAVGTSLLKLLINFAKGDWVSPGKSQCLVWLFTFNLFLPEMDFAKGLQKMANSCKQIISQEVSPQVPEAPSARLDGSQQPWRAHSMCPSSGGHGGRRNSGWGFYQQSPALPCLWLFLPEGHISLGSHWVLRLREMCFPSPQTNMPFLSIYLLALEQDMEHGTSVLQAANTLQQQTFLQVRGQKVLPGTGAPGVAGA